MKTARIYTQASISGHFSDSRVHGPGIQPSRRRPSRTPRTLDEIVVTGIRSSLESSMSLKRDAQGVVDGIVAEDIGKFPDTNLAESLQRISGVSIDRSIGEGSRGHGPRRRPGLQPGAAQRPADAGREPRGHGRVELARVRLRESRLRGDRGDRGLQDQPRRARRPAASARRSTSRPRVRSTRPGLHTELRREGASSTLRPTTCRIACRATRFTPEISGIFSNTFADDKFGVALDRELPGARSRLQPGGGGQRLAPVRG